MDGQQVITPTPFATPGNEADRSPPIRGGPAANSNADTHGSMHSMALALSVSSVLTTRAGQAWVRITYQASTNSSALSNPCM